MLAHEPILALVARDDVRAAVRRDGHGFLWISQWRAGAEERVAGTRLDDELDPRQIHGQPWTAIGGALPHDARSAEVRGDDGAWHQAVVAHRVWIAFVPRAADRPGLAPVRFHDELRSLVSRTTAATLAASRPLAEAESALLAGGHSGLGGDCPACGEHDWRAAPSPSARSGTGARIFCAGCGHSDGAVYGFACARAQL